MSGDQMMQDTSAETFAFQAEINQVFYLCGGEPQ
jgi:hypothetical protein